MAKRYIKINFQNAPSTATPLNATTLNKMDKGIDDCDNAIEELYDVKANKTDIVNVQTNNAAKICGAALAYSMGQQITSLSSKIAVIDKNVVVTTANTDVTDTLDYPAGFTSSNCRAIASLQSVNSTNGYNINKMTCSASASNISIRLNASAAQTYTLVIVLIKTS